MFADFRRKRTSRGRPKTCGAKEHNGDLTHHEQGGPLHLHTYTSYACFLFCYFVLYSQVLKKKRRKRKQQRSKGGTNTEGDNEATLTDGFQSCLAEDDEFSANREATHAPRCDFCFQVLCIHVVEFLILCVIFVGKGINGAFKEEQCWQSQI